MQNAVPLSWYLILSAILFGLGVAGFIFRFTSTRQSVREITSI